MVVVVSGGGWKSAMVVSGGEWWRLMAVVSGGQWWWSVVRMGLATGAVMAPPPPTLRPHMADPSLLLGTWTPRTSICRSFYVPSVGDNAVPVQKV